MRTFLEWITNPELLLWLIESYDLDPAEYDRLFDEELKRLLPRITDPNERTRLQAMVGNTRWTGYLATALRAVGFRDQASLQEKTHDVVVKLLVSPGGLFRNYDEKRHGPFDRRWKCSVANATKNVAEKERNRRRLVPTVAIDQEFKPGGVMDLPDRASAETDERVIEDFRRLVSQRLGQLALAVLDARLAGQETKSLVDRTDLGNPSRWSIKHAVQSIKSLVAREFAERRGNAAFLRDIDRAMERESETVIKRFKTAAARVGVG